MAKELLNPMRIRLDKDLDNQLNALAIRRGESKAELCRRLLRKAVAQEIAQDSIDPVTIAVRQAMADVLKPVEERLAKINAKTAIAAATAMYTNMQVYSAMGKDARALHEAARKQAVVFVKQPHDQMISEANG